MKIVQLAPLEETVPPQAYGGTELVVGNITEELVKRGHDVYLIGAGKCQTSANFVPVLNRTLRQLYPWPQQALLRERTKLLKLGEALVKIQNINPDIIHNHTNWRGVAFSKLLPHKMVTTCHDPLTDNLEIQLYKQSPDHNFISISNNQRKAIPELNWIGTVYNGIDPEKYSYGNGMGDYFLFLGRTSPEKGLAEICQLIKQTSHKLKIAAKIDAADKDYFFGKVKPYIDGKQIEFLGEVGHREKNLLLSNAKALLLWLNWEEPFGLVVTEAMACGTPVIVNKRGSMPEIIDDSINGFLVDSLEDMKRRMDDVSQINREKCREKVIKHFSLQSMVTEYEKYYQKTLTTQ